jgi:hypothetical protein
MQHSPFWSVSTMLFDVLDDDVELGEVETALLTTVVPSTTQSPSLGILRPLGSVAPVTFALFIILANAMSGGVRNYMGEKGRRKEYLQYTRQGKQHSPCGSFSTIMFDAIFYI